MIRVGVLRGGANERYDESLASGAFVLRSLPRQRYEVVDIFVDTDGVWHIGGKPVSYDKLRHRVDVVWNALGGFYGADGKVQHALQSLSIPYVGSGPLSSAIAMHRTFLKEHLAALGIKTPRGVVVESWPDTDAEREAFVAETVARISHDFSPPWIVAPISRGLSIGPTRARTRDELASLLLEFSRLAIPVVIEEEVFGKESSVISVPGFRGQKIYTFLPRTSEGGRHDPSAKEALESAARATHSGLHLGHYSRIEAIVARSGQVYVTSVDTVPSFAPDSDIHAALEAVGASFAELADHLIPRALADK